LINAEKWVGLDRNTIRRLNFRGLTLIPTPGKNVNKIMEKLLKRYRMLTQADMEKTKKELKFEPEYDIRERVRKILKHLEWHYIPRCRNHCYWHSTIKYFK